MLPNFLVIGAMKAGTTSLFRYLSEHPDIVMPWSKELDFFSNDEVWGRGLSWYEAQFQGQGSAVGEASPNYAKRHLFPDTASRIIATLPDVRLIYLVRDPIERLQSMYVDMLAYGGETRPLEEAVRADPDYILTSCYGFQLEPFLAEIDRDRVLVLRTGRLRQDRIETVGKAYRFLGVVDDHIPSGIDDDANTRAEKRVPTKAGRRLLEQSRYRSTVDADTRWSSLHDRLLTRPPRRSDVALSPGLRSELAERFHRDRDRLRALLGHDPFEADRGT